MVIIGKFKPGYHEGQKFEAVVESIETIFDGRGGNYMLISVAGKDWDPFETWQLEWYNIFNMPHQEQARQQIAEILHQL